jgi:hypothetical protein
MSSFLNVGKGIMEYISRDAGALRTGPFWAPGLYPSLLTERSRKMALTSDKCECRAAAHDNRFKPSNLLPEVFSLCQSHSVATEQQEH